MSTLFVLAIVAVVIVIFFDFTNGFHDASNVVATVIASNAMTPRQAVVIVGTFHFLGPILGGTAVANTIGGFVNLSDQDPASALLIVLSGLSGAIGWNLLTWWRGIPSSSSHALVGALAGVVVVAVGSDHVVWGVSELTHGAVKGVVKVVLGLLVSPILGFVFAFILHRVVRRQMNRATPRANAKLRYAQWVTAAMLSFTHGANDAQKSMGILTLVLVLGGFIGSFSVPFWVIFICAGAITIGTVLGGWRIVRTLGFSIFKIRPLHAFDSQLASAGIILAASAIGAPVSTTHVVSTSIMGIGASERPKSVHWDKAREIALTWVITIPGAALMAIAMFAFAHAVVRLAVR
jgi:PiT family inorganic phosphate transporter